MTSSAINGVWIYRSFRNLTSPTPSFDELKVWEAEFYLEVVEAASCTGRFGSDPRLPRVSNRTPTRKLQSIVRNRLRSGGVRRVSPARQPRTGSTAMSASDARNCGACRAASRIRSPRGDVVSRSRRTSGGVVDALAEHAATAN